MGGGSHYSTKSKFEGINFKMPSYKMKMKILCQYGRRGSAKDVPHPSTSQKLTEEGTGGIGRVPLDLPIRSPVSV